MPNKINGKKKPQNKAHYSEISKHRTFIVKKKRGGRDKKQVL